MSALPFNPMRKTPPPPPHIDTVSFDPTEYVRVISKDNHQLFVNCACLRVSPFIRRAIAKRVNVETDDVIIIFDAQPPESEGSDDVEASASLSAEAEPSREASPAEDAAERTTPEREGTAQPNTDATGGEAGEEEQVVVKRRSSRPPIVTVEKLRHDASIALTFPKVTGATLDTVIAYLYYKQRYEGVQSGKVPEMEVPIGSAIDIMKLAAVLEC